MLCPCGEKGIREGEEEKDKEKLSRFLLFSNTQPNAATEWENLISPVFLHLFYKSLLSPPIRDRMSL